jgi:hypothetical protein
MSKMIYHWILNDPNGSTVMRYCPHCGRKTVFIDSHKRRRNANGKTIFEYGIYKCERNHTWNRWVNTYRAGEDTKFPKLKEQSFEMSRVDEIQFMELINEGIEEIDIFLEEVIGKWRMDKLLGDRIRDVSRTKLCEMICQGRVLLDGKKVKQNVFLKRRQKITIILKAFEQ